MIESFVFGIIDKNSKVEDRHRETERGRKRGESRLTTLKTAAELDCNS